MPFYGVYPAVVTNTDDPEKRGRIKCQIPDVLSGEVESAWCEPVVAVAYDKGGDFCVPQLKECVWVAFIGGDENRPVYLGGWWQENMTPLGEKYENLEDTRIISFQNAAISMHKDVISLAVQYDEHKWIALKVLEGGVQIVNQMDETHKSVIDLGSSSGVTVNDQHKNSITTTENGMSLKDKSSNSVTMTESGTTIKDASNNTVTMTSSGVSMKDASGNQVSLSGGNISIQASGSITIKAGGTVTIQGSSIRLN